MPEQQAGYCTRCSNPWAVQKSLGLHRLPLGVTTDWWQLSSCSSGEGAILPYCFIAWLPQPRRPPPCPVEWWGGVPPPPLIPGQESSPCLSCVFRSHSSAQPLPPLHSHWSHPVVRWWNLRPCSWAQVTDLESLIYSKLFYVRCFLALPCNWSLIKSLGSSPNLSYEGADSGGSDYFLPEKALRLNANWVTSSLAFSFAYKKSQQEESWLSPKDFISP